MSASPAPEAERRPWMLDDHLYPVATGIHDDGSPRIERLRRRDFPRRVLASKYNSHFKWGSSDRWRCFLSGVQCHWAPAELYVGPAVRSIPWALSIDHLVPLHLCSLRGEVDRRAVRSLANQAIVGQHLNRKSGHIPLALKLLHRQVLAATAYDRDDASHATLSLVRGRIIATEDALKLHGHYPWQPWTYAEPGPRAAADAFMAEMAAFERRFLAIDRWDRPAFVEAFAWRW